MRRNTNSQTEPCKSHIHIMADTLIMTDTLTKIFDAQEALKLR